ncbi:Calcium/calmodulin-dependent protein kinase [Bertholletia excelsa]
MPQVDIEALVSVCTGAGDNKIACETLADGDAEHRRPAEEPEPEPEPEPDLPPESFWLSRGAEYDWFDRNAFYERKESMKANSSPTSTNLNPGLNPSSASSSQRFSMNLKSKAAIIGLPKTQTNFVDTTNRRSSKPANIRLFPKKSEPVGKSGSVKEPTSPKVSCMGRVRSKRGRLRSSQQEASATKPDHGRRRARIYRRLVSIFRSGRRTEPEVKVSEVIPSIESPPRRSVTVETRQPPQDIEPAATAEPPGLGGMTRFASGRRSETWGTGGTAEPAETAGPPGLGGMMRFASGRRSESWGAVDQRTDADVGNTFR